jgi:transketolase
MNKNTYALLKKRSAEIKKHVIDSTYSAASGHPGGSLSISDILAILYFYKMNIRPEEPKWEDRDRLVLSKGHAAPALYGVLAERGYFSKNELKRLRRLGSILQGHPDMKKIPGVDISTGSLGMGLSAANGMALAAKYRNRKYKVYCIIGDGEIQEGQIWEAAMTSTYYKLDNLTVFLDYNGLQIDGKITEVMSPEPVDEKFKAFGWNVLYTDGHDIVSIINALEKSENENCKPSIIICKTIKGAGVSFMENKVEWHGMAPDEKQRNTAINELNDYIKEIEGENG